MTNRRLAFDKIKSGRYYVFTFVGTALGEVRRLTGPNGPCWRAVTPDGTHMPVDFTSRQDAGEALFQAAEDRSRAARDADVGRGADRPLTRSAARTERILSALLDEAGAGGDNSALIARYVWRFERLTPLRDLEDSDGG